MFLYFGAKARLAPTYQAPRFALIVEPFAGAAGYAMHWLVQRSDLSAVLVDSDPLVVSIWEKLLSMEPSDLWDYPLPKEGELSTDPLHLLGAVSSGSWGRMATRGDFRVTPWQASGFARRRREMAHTLAKVRGRVRIQLGHYTDAPNEEATWFIDPPYQQEGIYYNSGNKLDFAALGDWSRARLGQVIACETVGADWLDFQPHVSNQTVINSSSVEAVWYSHPDPTLLDLMEIV